MLHPAIKQILDIFLIGQILSVSSDSNFAESSQPRTSYHTSEHLPSALSADIFVFSLYSNFAESSLERLTMHSIHIFELCCNSGLEHLTIHADPSVLATI